MDISREIQKLRLFNEKANKLGNSRFADKILNEPSGVKMNMMPGAEAKAEYYGPDAEAIDAFVLTLRLFIQKTEQISLANMVKLYSNLPVNPAISAKVNEAVDGLNEFLACPLSEHSSVKTEFQGEEPTRQQLIDFIIYGDLAHVDTPKRAIFSGWQENSIAYPFLQNAFVVTLDTYLKFILWVRDLNELSLKEIAQQCV